METARDATIGDEVLDLTKAPLKSAKAMKYTDLDKNLVDMLLDRDVSMGLCENYKPGNVLLRYSSNVFRADRKGTASGRLVTDYRTINEMCVLLSVQPALAEDIHRHLMQPRILAYSEQDLAKAFNCISHKENLQCWLAIQTADRTLLATKGQLGFQCMPAVWSALVYPFFNSLAVNDTCAQEFWEDLVEAVQLDAGLPGLGVKSFAEYEAGQALLNVNGNIG